MKSFKCFKISFIIGLLSMLILWSYCNSDPVYLINYDSTSILTTDTNNTANTDTTNTDTTNTTNSTDTNTNVSTTASTNTNVTTTASTGSLPKDATAPEIKKFTIDNSAPTTSDLKVILVIVAEDDTAVDKMMTSNDGTSWSEWIAYEPVIFDYELSAGADGQRTVYVRVKDVYGNESEVKVATINFLAGSDTSLPTLSSVSINNGDASTASLNAQVVVLATDDISVTEMAWSTDGVTYSAWQAYSPLLNATLASGIDGTRTLYVKVKDGAGNESTALSDTIEVLSNVYVDSMQPIGNPCSISSPCNSIQTGINTAQNLGLSSVNVAAGTYTETLVVTGNISLYGGWDSSFAARNPSTNITTIVPAGTSSTTISFFNNNNTATIDGFTIKGSDTVSPTYALHCAFNAHLIINNNKIIGSEGSSALSYGVYINNGSSPTISNSEVIGTSGTGATTGSAAIYATGNGCNITVDSNSNITGSNGTGAQYRYGIYLYDQASATITNNTLIKGNDTAYYGYGIYLDSSCNATIDNNSAIVGSSTYGHTNTRAIFLDNASSATISNNSIYGVDSSGNGIGIYLRNDSYATIDSNTIIQGGYDTTSYGIYSYDCEGSGITTNITNNTKIQGATTGTGYGIYFRDLDANTININSNAEIFGSDSGTGNGIYLTSTGGVGNATININSNTSIYGTNSGAGTDYAIFIQNAGGSATMNGNTSIIGCKGGGSGTYYGIYIADGLNTVSIQNTVTEIKGSNAGSGTAGAIYINNTTNDIADLTIDNNPLIIGSVGPATSNAYGIYTGRVNANCYIRNNTTIKGATDNSANAYGVYLYYGPTATNFEISNSTIIQGVTGDVTTSAYGIYIQTGSITNGSITNIGTVQGASGTATNAYGIYATGGTTLSIDTITTKVEGSAGNAATNAYGIRTGNFTDLTIEDIPLIQGSGGDVGTNAYGIYCGATNLTITDITTAVKGAVGDTATALGIYTNYASTATEISNIPLIIGADGDSTANGRGIQLNAIVQTLTINNNTTIQGSNGVGASTKLHGIFLSGVGTSGTITGSTIKGGKLINAGAAPSANPNGAHGIFMSNGTFANLTINNNTITGSDEITGTGKSTGIYRFADASTTSSITINNNTIKGTLTGGNAGTTTTDASARGIYLYRYSHPTITNNTISGNDNGSGAGIVIYNLYNTGGRIKIDKNFIYGSKGSNSDCYGIQQYYNYQSLTNEVTITNNIIKANNGNGLTGYAIMLSSTRAVNTYSIITNNILYGGAGDGTTGNASAGIALYRTTGNLQPLIQNNIIYNDDSAENQGCYAIKELSGTANPSKINNNMGFDSQYWYFDNGSTSRAWSEVNNAATTCNPGTCINNLKNTKTMAQTFTNEIGNVYTPVTGADNINAGMDTSDIAEGGVVDDYTGSTARPQGAAYDIGAYET